MNDIMMRKTAGKVQRLEPLRSEEAAPTSAVPQEGHCHLPCGT